MSPEIRQVGVLIDVTRCTGCNQCVQACAEAHQLGEARPTLQQSPDGLSAVRWSAIVESPQGGFVRKACRHCLEPACVSACPVGAMYQTAQGIVLYDSLKCMGCRYCMMACPFGIPRYEWDTAAPLVRKCDLCYERLGEGDLPACVQACPEQVMVFGERNELLALAHQRIDQAPGQYLPVVYGETEAGGTSVMYVSHVPLDFLGFKGATGDQALPDLTWNWLGKVPGVALATTGMMAGLFWIIGRRMQAEEARLVKQANTEGGPG